MKETILHYVWQFKLFSAQFLHTNEGQKVEVIDVGRLNNDAGPDFFNAKLKIDGIVWAGNIEIHVKSSDWTRHNHHLDTNYDSVILHVVNEIDTEIRRTNGELIPQMKLDIPPYILENYTELLAQKKWIPCEDKLSAVPVFVMNSWKNRLLIERLESKVEAIETLLTTSQNHWEEAFYVSLAQSFGFSTNGQAFWHLAKSLPLSVLGKHKDNLFQIEALLFGQAGLLEKNGEENGDNYFQKLKKEYEFLKSKYGLTSIDGAKWKLLRLRPDNFPHIRIAQFAMLIHKSSKLFSKIIKTTNIGELRTHFVYQVSDYWQNHYLFGKKSPFSTKKIGKNSVDILIINTVIPFLFVFFKKKGEDIEKVLSFLEEIPAEKNTIIQKWDSLGFKSKKAFDTQAFIQLKKQYCDLKKCLQCPIGHQVLALKTN